MSWNDEPNAPIAARALAFLVDLLAVFALSFCAIAALSFVLPLDRRASFTICLGVGMSVGFGYFIWGTPLLGGTLGKSLFGMRVVSVDESRPRISAVRWLVRTLLGAFLWPLSVILILSSGAMQHLGDRLAHTRVVRLRTHTNNGLPTVVSFVLLFALGKAAGFAMATAAQNTGPWKAARAALGEDAKLLSLVIKDDVANVGASVGAQGHELSLVREGNGWTIFGENRRSLVGMASEVSISFDGSGKRALHDRIVGWLTSQLEAAAGGSAVEVRCPEGELIGEFQCRADFEGISDIELRVTRKGGDLTVKPRRLAFGATLAESVTKWFVEDVGAGASDWRCPKVQRFSATEPVVCTGRYQERDVRMKLELNDEENFVTRSIEGLPAAPAAPAAPTAK